MTRQEKLTRAVWYSMMYRCYTPYHKDYKRYGALGIKVCEKWHTLDGFIDDMGLKPDGMTLERRDNDGPYELANCLWATRQAQARNRSNNVMLTYNGRTMSIDVWSEELGIAKAAIRSRIRYGYPIEQVLYQGNLRGKR